MLGGLVVRTRWIRERIEAQAERHGLFYPWWIPVTATIGPIVITALALAQRDALATPRPVTLSLMLVAGACLGRFATKRWVPWWATAVVLLAAVAWMLADSSRVAASFDLAPAVLAFLAAEVTATDGARVGIGVTTLSIGLLAVDGLDGRLVHVLEILLGLMVGGMLRWQMRAFLAERDARNGERERATLAERQRIAREIHDLVGHSLSVNLLHVTGARRALDEDRDIDEALDSLRDAERTGRQAMADIRRTVGVLNTESTGARPLPGGPDIDSLVADVRSAGLDVTYDSTGDPNALSGAVGLGVYRVVQESLANVVKHAPGASARVRLAVTSERLELRIANRLPPHPTPGDGGTGVAGMTARAEQLGGSLQAGPCDGEWMVDLDVPVEDATVDGDACLVRRMLP